MRSGTWAARKCCSRSMGRVSWISPRSTRALRERAVGGFGDVGEQRDRRRFSRWRRSRPAARPPGPPVHTDAVQAFGKMPVSVPRAALHPAHHLRSQDRGAQGRRRAGGAGAQGCSTPSSTAVASSSGSGPEPRTWRGRWDLGRAAQLAGGPSGDRGRAPGSAARSAGAAPAPKRCPTLGQRRRGAHRAPHILNVVGAGRRQRGAADAPRPRRGRRLGGIGLLDRARSSLRTCSPRWASRASWRWGWCASAWGGNPDPRTSIGWWRCSREWSQRCGGWRRPWVVPERVLVAMSGGVDSSVAAAAPGGAGLTTSSAPP